MTKEELEEKAKEFATKTFQPPYSPDKEVVTVVDPDLYEGYIAGYEQAEKDLGWIKCSERMPVEDFDDGYQMLFVAIHVEDYTWRFDTDYIMNGKWALHPYDNIVYWMTIPNEPIDDDKEK